MDAHNFINETSLLSPTPALADDAAVIPHPRKTLQKLVIIDSSVDDYTMLANGIINSAEVAILDKKRDGIQQIAEILATKREIDELHLVSHGSPGCLYLGNAQLNCNTLPHYRTQLQQWQKALKKSTNLILYGCQVAAETVGYRFLHHLHHLLGTGIAATDTLTGNPKKGGDWNFQVKIGAVFASAVFSPEIIDAYPSLLSGLVWAKKIGGINYDSGFGITVDASGNIYASGLFSSSIDINSDGIADLTFAGSNDAYIAKFNSDGSFAWAKKVGGSSWDTGRGIAVDSSGNAYATGWFSGSIDINSDGTADLTSAGNDDAYIAKFNSDGTFAWAKKVGGSSWDYGMGIAVDSFGKAYATGRFSGSIDTNGDGTPDLISAGGEDAYIAKFNSDGTLAWAKNFGGSYSEGGGGIAVDSSGNVYATGYFPTTIDINSDGTPDLTSAGLDDAYIAKFNSDGTIAWAKNFGGSGYDASIGIAVDSSGNAYVTGYFSNSIDINSDGTADLTSAGSYDAYIAKFNSDGTLAWAKNIGGSSWDFGMGITLDNSGNAYGTGYFSNSIDIDGNGTADLTSAGNRDAYIVKFNSDGTFAGAKNIGQSSADEGSGIAVDSSGNVITTGYFSYSIDINGDGTPDLISAGGNDAYIVKLDITPPTATVTATDITTAGATSYQFTVTYSDNLGIDVTSLDNSDIRVTATNGFDQLATFVSATPTGNGTPRSATYTVTPGDGSWDLADNGTYTIALEASQVRDTTANAAAATTLGSFTVNIPNTTPVVNTAITDTAATAGTAFNFSVPANTFTDADGDTLTYTATLADGSSLPSWLTFNPATATFSGTPTDTDIGSINIQVTASDGTDAVSDIFAVNVSAAPNQSPVLDNSISDTSATVNQAFSLTVPAATFTDADGDTLTYTATLADGSSLPSWLSFDAVTGTFSGTPNTTDIGSINIQVTASDSTDSVSDIFAVNVSAAPNQSPVLDNSISDTSATANQVFSLTVPAATFTDADGDTLTYTATLADGSSLPSWLTFNPATATFSGTPNTTDIGSINIQVTASDGTDAVSDIFAVNVSAVLVEPTPEPISLPTEEPTPEPISLPTEEPTPEPISLPTEEPTPEPISLPTEEPTSEPISLPTEEPTSEPISLPTEEPTSEPISLPTEEPTSEPISLPTEEPTSETTTQLTPPSPTVPQLPEVALPPTRTESEFPFNLAQNDSYPVAVALDNDCNCPPMPAPPVVCFEVATNLVATELDDVVVGGDNNNVVNGLDGHDIIFGLGGDDVIIGGKGSEVSLGNSGDNDILFGATGNDLIEGSAGEDVIFAGQGHDIVCGGKDNDDIWGDIGNDILMGDMGSDRIFGGTSLQDREDVTGTDILYGGEGDDTLNGNQANDSLSGGVGNDVLCGGKDDDLLHGDEGNDMLWGDLGDDTLCGGNGDDTLIGDNHIYNTGGNDLLCGGNGDDVLIGGFGNDSLKGGKGNDTFVLGDGTDMILDFLVNADIIQLPGYPAEYRLAEVATTIGQYIGLDGVHDTEIYRTMNGNDELIGVVQGISGLTLESAAFSFG